MTRNPPGYKHPSGDSEKVPINDNMPVTEDGPEGDSEDGQTGESEDNRTEAQLSSSSNTSSQSEVENYRKHEHVTGILEAGTETPPDFPGMRERCLTLPPSLFGSPLAYASYQNKHDFFKGLLPESTRVLFDEIVAEASTLRKGLLTEPALLDNGCNGRFCALRKRRSWTIDSDVTEESESDESRLQLYGFGPGSNRLWLPLVILANSIDSSSSTPSENSDPEVTIEVRRVQDSETGEVDYFVVNESLNLRINGTCLDRAVAAGPLPDFAVIELEHSSFFWWRTAAALDYVPSLKRKRSSEDDDEEASSKAFKYDTDPPPSLQVFSDSRSWLDEYRRRLNICKRRPIKYTSSITELHPPHQYPAGEMHDIDVILAIGAVWLGLIEANVDFAYANSDFFSFARSIRMVGMHAVKEAKPFLIPLLFNEELEALSPELGEDTAEPLEPVFSAFQRGEEEKHQESFAAAEEAKQKDPGNKNRPPPSLEDQEVQNRFHKGGIGHFMLAIAEKVSRGGHDTLKDVLAKKALVRLRFMDSAKGIVDKGMIRRVARNTVRNSGWLGDIWPRFDVREEYWEDVLVQSGNRCGEHTVLNAWAYMLGIPLAATRDRALGTSSYNEVRKMILLALRGQLDSLTIRAWMQHFKYAVDEPLSQLQQTQRENPDLSNNIPNMQTVALNEDAFNEIVSEMYAQEQAENQALAKRWGAVTVESGDASAKQLVHTPEVAGGVPMPPSSQDSVAGISGLHGTSAIPTGPAKRSSPARPSIRSPRNWRESLVRGLANNQALKAKNVRTTQGARKDASVIPSFSNMADYDVILGIAPIWEGLKRLRRADFDFTYAGMDVFAPGGGQKSVGAVGRWSRFIMPLFFSPVDDEILEYPGDGNEQIQYVGHLVLCVAELVNDQPMTVQLQIFDSRPGTVPVPTIMDKAREIIQRSDWLHTNGSKTPVLFRPASVMRTPQQVGRNTCGLHVILNAWTYMLGIPIHPYKLRRGRTEKDEGGETDHSFLKGGLELVNLALAGFMDSATIQAFLNAYGYSVEQRFGDPARAVIPVNAVGMNQEKLLYTLQKRQAVNALTLARAENKTFPDEAMAYLMGGDMNEEQAWTALAVARGDRERAIDWHYCLSPRGVLPAPEDALSPKTPDRRRNSS